MSNTKNIPISSGRRVTRGALALAGATWLSGGILAHAVMTPIVPVAPRGSEGDDVTWFVDPGSGDHTGLRFENLSETSGNLGVMFQPGPPAITATGGSPYAQPFVMLDNTLSIDASAFPPGEFRMRVRIGYDRAGLVRRHLRRDTVHVMRLDSVERRWVPAIFANRSGTFQWHPDSPPVFRAGHFGIDRRERFGWVVLDRNGTYGLAAVPEPTPFVLIAGGLVLLAASRRRRRKAPGR